MCDVFKEIEKDLEELNEALKYANDIKRAYSLYLITLTDAISCIRNRAISCEGSYKAISQEKIAKILMSKSRTFTKLTD